MPFAILEGGVENNLATAFRKHAQLYCLATEFKVDPLIETTTKRMVEVEGLDFRSLMDIAKEVYPKLQDNDAWFRSYVKRESSKALMENPNLAEEKWILDAYENFGGRLAVDLFTTFVACYKTCGGKVGEKMQEAANDPPILSVRSEIKMAESFVGQCPDQAEHLKKKGKYRQWKYCAWCREDRRRVLREVSELMIDTPATLADVKKRLQEGLLLVEKILTKNEVDTLGQTVIEHGKDQLREPEREERELRKGGKKSNKKLWTKLKKGKEKQTGKKQAKMVRKEHKDEEAICDWAEYMNISITRSPYESMSEDDLPKEPISSSARMGDAHERNADELVIVRPSANPKTFCVKEHCYLHKDSAEKQHKKIVGQASEPPWAYKRSKI